MTSHNLKSWPAVNNASVSKVANNVLIFISDWRLRVETATPIRPTAWRRPHSNQKPARYPGGTADGVSWDQLADLASRLSKSRARSRGPTFERPLSRRAPAPFHAAAKRAIKAPTNPTASTPKYIKFTGPSPMMPAAALIKTRTNPVAHAMPTAARYAIVPPFLAISSYVRPVPNRRAPQNGESERGPVPSHEKVPQQGHEQDAALSRSQCE